MSPRCFGQRKSRFIKALSVTIVTIQLFSFLVVTTSPRGRYESELFLTEKENVPEEKEPILISEAVEADIDLGFQPVVEERETVPPKKKRHKADVLVTGCPRGGTTVTGEILAFARHTKYYHEPMSTDTKNFCAGQMRKPKVERKLDIITNIDRPSWIVYFQDLFAKCKAGDDELRVIIKDPLAIKYSDMLAENFNMVVIVKIRHPASLIASDCARVQNFRMKTSCSDEKIQSFLKARVEQLRILLDLYKRFAATRPDQWMFQKHEDFCRDPNQASRDIYDFVGFDYTQHVERRVNIITSSKNRVETKSYHQVRLNAAAQINRWKSVLSPRHAHMVKTQTEFFWKEFYTEEDWAL